MSGEIFEKIYAVVRKIPKGKVATYGQVAAAAGNPHWSQVVGYALHANPDPATIKCHRVVNRFGGLSPAFAFGGIHAHAEPWALPCRHIGAIFLTSDDKNSIMLK